MTALPLTPHPSTRFIPWITAAMMYLACLASVGAALLFNYGCYVRETHHGCLTCVIPLYQENQRHPVITEFQKILTPFMVSQRLIKSSDAPKTLKNVSNLPYPWPIIVEGKLKNTGDLNDCKKAVLGAFPKAKMFVANEIVQPLVMWIDSLMLVVILVVMLILGLSWLVTSSGTAISLHIHQAILELLDLLGANKTYVLKQFYTLTLHHLKKAVILWAACMASSLCALFFFRETMAIFLFSSLGFFLPLLLAGVIAVLSIFILITTRWTVLRLLHASSKF